jgi:flagellar biosynthetic protein FlhB
MSEESDLEKTEAASPRRLEKAREEGQVARSRELGTFLLLATGVAALWLMGNSLYVRLSGVLRGSLGFDPSVARDADLMVTGAMLEATQAVSLMLPLFGALVVVAIGSSVALGGLVFSGKALMPKFSKLNPATGIGRLFSAQTVVELFKTLSKAILVGTIGVYVIWSRREEMLALMHAPTQVALSSMLGLVATCCTLIVASLLVIVAIDVPWQIFSHLKKLRMSKEDVKQEHKESEGDPHIKARVRQQQRAMSKRRMMAQVPDADVIVTNPTHYAVALKYSESAGGAPKVTAKGSGLVAARIREVAVANRIPLLSAPPLARALHKHVELDGEIPAALYTAVAEVLAWVFQLRAWRPGAGKHPQMPRDLPVPDDWDPLALLTEEGKIQ